MHEEKSRGSGLESRKTRLGRYELRDPREGYRGRSGKTGSARLLRPRHGASEKKFGMDTKNPVREEIVRRCLCTVDRSSDRDHLFTGEGEGGEESFECDGTTRQGREKKWHVDEAREFGDFWLKSGRVVTGIPGGFPAILAGLGLGKGLDGTWVWAGG
ncbi:hypothetical protein CRG98_023704 [Punica granatum]|uniref:Uncharacterized protein n=1 Tax=Punica granatum TaxID=22663 RepID=A0A2I0JHZ5_PUNGR|nr:hypothetical protein CRG98_023704 [Punica granatum]